MSVLLVLTNVPDAMLADRMAQALVDQGCAACVNVLAPCTSVYRWRGGVERSAEIPLLIKTTQQHYAAVESAIRKLHSYELPEIIAVPVTQGLPAYLAWVESETTGQIQA
jgi:periplasmic divalent cation tolerance protein